MKKYLLIVVLLTATSTCVRAQPDIAGHLRPSKIIALGEAQHGMESFNREKAVLCRLLYDTCGMRGVVFESPFVSSMMAYMDHKNPSFRLSRFLYPFWNTASVSSALYPFFDMETEKKYPVVAGFDMQEDCRFRQFTTHLIQMGLSGSSRMLLTECDTILSSYIGPEASQRKPMDAAVCKRLVSYYKTVQEEVCTPNIPEAAILQQCFQNRIWLCMYLTIGPVKERMHFRDSLMARNIIWFQEHIYKDKPFIVWTANTHAARKISAADKAPGWMGEWLSEQYGENYYAVSFVHGTNSKAITGTDADYFLTRTGMSKFDLVVYVHKAQQVDRGAWITPCVNSHVFYHE